MTGILDSVHCVPFTPPPEGFGTCYTSAPTHTISVTRTVTCVSTTGSTQSFTLVSCTWHFSLFSNPLFSTSIPFLLQNPSFSQVTQQRRNKGILAMMIQDEYKTQSLLYLGTTGLVIVIPVPIPDFILIITHPTIVVLFKQPTNEDVGSSFHLTHLQLGPQLLLHDR